MKERMSVARCCCDPEGGECACTGTVPAQFQIDLAGLVDGSNCTCDEFNGTHVIDFDFTTFQQCAWREGLSPAGSFALLTIHIYLGNGLNQFGDVEVDLRIQDQTTNCPGFQGESAVFWFRDNGGSAQDCDGFSAYNVPFNTDSPGPPDFCDGSAATAELTAL